MEQDVVAIGQLRDLDVVPLGTLSPYLQSGLDERGKAVGGVFAHEVFPLVYCLDHLFQSPAPPPTMGGWEFCQSGIR